jgi:cell division protein FtsN
MPRDYAKASSREKKPGQLPGWVWMLGGLAIGLFVAFLVYLNNTQKPGQKNALAKVLEQTISDVREVKKQQVDTPPAAPPAKETRETPAEKPKPSFDFYYILPELEVAVPEQELAAQHNKPESQIDGDVEYILQAGSFKQLEQADQLKAKLAIQGIESSIQSVSINSDTWHRVRIGPIRNVSKLDQVRKRLRDSGIAAIVVKSKT